MRLFLKYLVVIYCEPIIILYLFEVGWPGNSSWAVNLISVLVEVPNRPVEPK